MKEVSGGVQLGTVFGIPLFVPTAHLTGAPFVIFWLFVAGLSGNGKLEDGFIFVFIVFGSVLLHELGHAFAARASGLHVRRIAFTWYGGYAEFAQTGSRLRQIAIALAGPGANLFIAGIAAALLLWVRTAMPDTASNVVPCEGANLCVRYNPDVGPGLLERSLSRLQLTNLGLGIFNLLPGLPLDGGHVLRSALSARLSWFRAHAIAMWCGVWIGLITIAAAYTEENLWMILIGASILLTAWASRTRPQLD